MSGFLVATNSWQRLHCVAGQVRFELRNVAANYPFERSHRFPGPDSNPGHRDHSRLSCDIGEMQPGARPLRTLRWTFPAKRASVGVTASKSDGLLLSPRQRPSASAGFRRWRRDLALHD
jgi:hypothetical protein